MHSWCHGDRPEPVVTARPSGMEYLRSTAVTQAANMSSRAWCTLLGAPMRPCALRGSRLPAGDLGC